VLLADAFCSAVSKVKAEADDERDTEECVSADDDGARAAEADDDEDEADEDEASDV
jgi:hypothetical protein